MSGTGQSIAAQDQVSGACEQLTDLIETTADVVPGDSGRALANRSGQVVGMIAAASEPLHFQPSANQGYAIPINEAESVASQACRTGHRARSTWVPRPFWASKPRAPSSGSRVPR